jgi:serine/threonine-protein kinase
MKKPDWDRIQEIYHEARKRARAERRAFVEQLSEGNTILAGEVLELLALDDPSFLDEPIAHLPLAPSEEKVVGETIGERYFIEKELGGGGMSRVYFARDLRVNRKAVVIKILSQELMEHPYARQKFEQEVEALSRIRHTGVIEVFDKGKLDDDRPYFAMQFIDGKDLRSQILPDGMNLEHAASILKQVGTALQHVHQKGIFHRDLKPENILLRRGTDSVVLIDFGIAQITDSDVAPITTDGQSAGTVMYMSPEQLRREEVTAASDIYAMAVIAYEMATGRRPFSHASESQLVERQRRGVDVKPGVLRPDLSPKAQDVILRGLSFKPEGRYQNAKQFGDELAQAFLDSRRRRPRKPWWKAATFVLGLALLSFGIYKYCQHPPPTNHSFSYYVTVQRMRDGQPYENSFRSHGDEMYDSGDSFRLTVSTPVPAYLYVFKEGPPEQNNTSFTMIYPKQATNNGSPSVGANQSVQSDSFTFRGLPGAENFWIAWSTSPIVELDAAISEAFKHPDGGLTGQTLVAVRQYLKAKEAEINTTTYNYNANKTAVVRGKRDLLVTLAQFKHR